MRFATNILLLREQEAVGSTPATPTKKQTAYLRTNNAFKRFFLCIEWLSVEPIRTKTGSQKIVKVVKK